MNKEQVYDEKVAPLMTQIIEICKESGIAMLASFAIPTEEDSGLRCTTCLPDEAGKNDPDHLKALRILKNEAPAMQIRTVAADGSQTITRFIG